MKGMAFQETKHGHESAAPRTVSRDRIVRIMRAGRFEPACPAEQRGNKDLIRANQTKTEPAHAPIYALGWRRCALSSAACQNFFKSANGCSNASRLGNTRSASPGARSSCSDRTNSRNTRLARLRRTAVPKRFPTTIPTRLDGSSNLHASKLNKAVEIRRPWRFTRSISRLARRNIVLRPAVFRIRHPTVSDERTPDCGKTHPEVVQRHEPA